MPEPLGIYSILWLGWGTGGGGRTGVVQIHLIGLHSTGTHFISYLGCLLRGVVVKEVSHHS